MVGAASMKFEEPFSNEKQISKRGLVHVFFLFIRRTREILLILMHDKYRIFYFLFLVNLYEYFSVINSLSFLFRLSNSYWWKEASFVRRS